MVAGAGYQILTHSRQLIIADFPSLAVTLHLRNKTQTK